MLQSVQLLTVTRIYEVRLGPRWICFIALVSQSGVHALLAQMRLWALFLVVLSWVKLLLRWFVLKVHVDMLRRGRGPRQFKPGCSLHSRRLCLCQNATLVHEACTWLVEVL